MASSPVESVVRATTGAKQNEVERVVAERESPPAEQRRQHYAYQQAQQRGDKTPMAEHADATQKAIGVAAIVSARHVAHRTYGESEIGRVANKLYG